MQNWQLKSVEAMYSAAGRVSRRPCVLPHGDQLHGVQLHSVQLHGVQLHGVQSHGVSRQSVQRNRGLQHRIHLKGVQLGRCHKRSGLAPLELVLWMPVLMFVAALMVNYGTAAAWRVRGEIAARDAADRQLVPRTGRNEPRPESWPRSDLTEEQAWAAELNGFDATNDPGEASSGIVLPDRARVYSGASTSQLTRLDDPAIQHEVVRGPLPNGFEAYPLLDPDSRGLSLGTAQIDRDYALLPTLGKYHSGSVRQALLGDSWAISRAYFSGTVPIPNEALFESASWETAGDYQGGVHRFSAVPNRYRRSKLLYHFPNLLHGPEQKFVAAMAELSNSHAAAGLRSMDADSEFLRWQGFAPDFYPRSVIACEIDRKRARQLSIEGRLVDYMDPARVVRLGGISRLPTQMVSAFLLMYLKVQIESQLGARNLTHEESAEIRQNIAALTEDLRRAYSFEEWLRNRRAGELEPSAFESGPTLDPQFTQPLMR